jgi:hypothetical protein
MSPYESYLSALGGLGRKVLRHGPDRASALCPVHEDHNPSLSVSRGADGRVLVYCHACGATEKELAQAVGWTVADLHPRVDNREPLTLHVSVNTFSVNTFLC